MLEEVSPQKISPSKAKDGGQLDFSKHPNHTLLEIEVDSNNLLIFGKTSYSPVLRILDQPDTIMSILFQSLEMLELVYPSSLEQ